ncbi:GNAT family N-acetyltransferase [Chlorogloeopsis sp. ULAP02]|uniref:GNAT family N-acetyltransferase n=1 Tax=Chlorogloeopsis sp. ULAP02 TaxID=3107926 RepID=UPI0031358731
MSSKQEPIIYRVSIDGILPLHQILIACGLDLQARFGLTHWLAPIYPLKSMLKDAEKLEVYAIKVGKNLVGTFTLEFATKVPLNYVKYGNICWQVANVPAVYVHKLAVLPEQQQKGLGTWCLGTIEKFALTRKYHAVRVDAVKTHSKLLSFYKSRGYQQVGELIYNSDTWVDAFVFEKVLTTENSVKNLIKTGDSNYVVEWD